MDLLGTQHTFTAFIDSMEAWRITSSSGNGEIFVLGL